MSAAPAEEEGGDLGGGGSRGGVDRARSRRRSAMPPASDTDDNGNSGIAKPRLDSSAGPVAEGLEQGPGQASPTVPVAVSVLTPSRSEALLEQDGGLAAAPDPGRSDLDLAGSAGGAPPSGRYGFRDIDPLPVRCEPSSPSTPPHWTHSTYFITYIPTYLLTGASPRYDVHVVASPAGGAQGSVVPQTRGVDGCISSPAGRNDMYGGKAGMSRAAPDPAPPLALADLYNGETETDGEVLRETGAERRHSGQTEEEEEEANSPLKV